jgi:cytochrome c oxidase assembly protein subunit 15
MLKKYFIKFNWLSLFFVFMLFAIGGLVRSTGSGMGCPDWPKCFGEYVPPTSEQDLPENYEDYFKNERIKKTERFVSLLKLLGFEEKANDIRNSKQLEETHQFNVTKAYVEYFNRIWGALTGIVVFLGFICSIYFIRSDFTLFFYTFLAFIAVFVNALLGAVVVSSNLISGLVSAHFLAAFASICFFMLARMRYLKTNLATKTPLYLALFSLALLVLFVFQTVLGTDVKSYFEALEKGDSVIINVILTEVPSYPTHRILAVVSLIVATVQYFLIRPLNVSNKFKKYALWIAILTMLQIIFGVSMIYEQMMALSKLFHISIAASIFGLQFYICTLLIKASQKNQLS